MLSNSMGLLTMVVLLMGCGSHVSKDYVPMNGQRVRVLKSQKDVNNRYSFAVRVSSDSGICSGVLISPHLVLTAAHCVCRTHKGPAGEAAMNASDCEKEATVETIIYEDAENEEDPGTGQQYEGSVRVNGRFNLVEGEQHPLKSIQADLALIRLGQGVGNVRTAKWQRRPPAKKGEFLFMVGYGYFDKEGRSVGQRRFGPNEVTAVDAEKFQFGKPGPHLMEADSGGACIRETKEGPELIGIMSAGGAPEIDSSTCTNTYSQPVQDWLKEQLKLAGDAS